MHLWDGLFRCRSSPGGTPGLLTATSLTPDSACNDPELGSMQADPLLQGHLSASTPELSQAAGSQPVSIPGTRVLPYSRIRAQSNNSISPSPRQQLLAESPNTDEVLGAAQQQSVQGAGALPNPTQQLPGSLRARAADPTPHKRPPKPPSPQARAQGSTFSHSPMMMPAWINPGDASGSSSGGRYSRILGTAVPGSYSGQPQLAAGSSSSNNNHRSMYQQQQQVGISTPSMSPSPSAESVLAAAVASDDVAAAAGNPYHPQHESAMQLLLQHQQHHLQQLQQQRRQQQPPPMTAVNSTPPIYQQPFCGSFGGQSPQSPRLLVRNSSQNRLSELGTSPGLIEASFMGMAARHTQHPSSHSATLEQMLQQQHATLRQQQEEQQRYLQHSRSAASFAEWGGSTGAGSRGPSRGSSGCGTPMSSISWAQQQQQLGGMGVSSPLTGTSALHGSKALPGRPGLHWLPRADESESAARGLLGLPRPGVKQPPSREQLNMLPLLPPGQQQHHMAISSLVEPGGRYMRKAASFGELQSAASGSSNINYIAHGTQQLSNDASAAGSSSRLHYQGYAVQEAPAPARDAGSSSSMAAAAAGANSGGLSPRSPSAVAAAASSPHFIRGFFASSASSAAAAPAGNSGSDSPLAAALSRSLSRPLSRKASFTSVAGGSGLPTCLICLDQLTSADFESGEAMQLDCRCKGEVALRHRQCAEKWSRIKGNTICDVCKAPILNLPEVPPLPPPPAPPGLNAEGGLTAAGAGLWGALGDEPPAAADYVFDCIRVTWVVLIVCILFFELSISRAFLTGALMGSAYVAFSASWAAAQRRRRRQEMTAAIWWEPR